MAIHKTSSTTFKHCPKSKPDLQYGDWRRSPSLHWTSRTPAFAMPQSKNYSCQTSNKIRSKISITYFRFGLAIPLRSSVEEAVTIWHHLFYHFLRLFVCSILIPQQPQQNHSPIAHCSNNLLNVFCRFKLWSNPPLGVKFQFSQLSHSAVIECIDHIQEIIQ